MSTRIRELDSEVGKIQVFSKSIVLCGQTLYFKQGIPDDVPDKLRNILNRIYVDRYNDGWYERGKSIRGSLGLQN